MIVGIRAADSLIVLARDQEQRRDDGLESSIRSGSERVGPAFRRSGSDGALSCWWRRGRNGVSGQDQSVGPAFRRSDLDRVL